MKVIVDYDGNPVCSIEVGNLDTVLFMKEKIERCLRIPVSKQILFFKGRVLLKDYLYVSQCDIVNDSRLQLLVSSNHSDPYCNNNQVLHQSPAPSNLNQQIIHGHQDWMSSNNSQVLQTTSMSNNNESLPSSFIDELLGIQDLPPVTFGSSRNTNQVVPELSPVPSNFVDELLDIQDFDQRTEDMIKMQSFWPQTTENINEVQESPMMVRSNNNQVLHHTEQFPPPSNSTGNIIDGQQRPMMVRGNNNQVLQTDQSPLTLASIQEIMKIKDRPWTNKDMIRMQSVWPQTTENISEVQESPMMVRSNNNQVFHQTEQFHPNPSNSTENIIDGQQWPMKVRSNNKQVLQTEQSPVTFPRIDESSEGKDQLWTEEEIDKLMSNLFDTSEENSNSQDSQVMVRSNSNEALWLRELEETTGIQDCQPVTVGTSRNNESSLPSNSSGELLGIQDLPPVTVGSKRNRNQTEQSSPSDSVKEIIDVTNSPVKKKIKTNPMKLTVMVQPFEETKRIPLEVNVRHNVKELRKQLLKLQERGELNLPERYFFIHDQAALDDDQSFWTNSVANGDTIEIFPGYVTYPSSTVTTHRWSKH